MKSQYIELYKPYNNLNHFKPCYQSFYKCKIHLCKLIVIGHNKYWVLNITYLVSIINVKDSNNGIQKTTRLFLTNCFAIDRVLNLVHDLEEISAFHHARYHESSNGCEKDAIIFRSEQG